MMNHSLILCPAVSGKVRCVETKARRSSTRPRVDISN